MLQPLWATALAALAALAFGTGCSPSNPPAADDKGYDLKGTVVSVDAAKQDVTLDHEDIPGLMGGMKDMQFHVEDAKLLEGLKTGDSVQGRVKKSDSGPIITKLEKR
jgi:Cu/Ag efflux protein CusF